MEFLREIGAFAGLAAFLGLAVLALLYFAQARDVRRLREAASFLVEGPEGAQGTAAPPGGSEPATETASSASATAPPADATPAEAAAFRRAELARQAAERRQRFERRRGGGGISRGGEGRFRSLPDAPALAVIIVGAVLLLAGIGFGATKILGGDEDQGAGAKASPAHQLSEIKVLNSTSEPGLAGDVARQLKQKGYEAGSDNTDFPFKESSVMFQGQASKDAADEIARVLQIQAVEPLSEDVRPDAGQAPVVVVIGDDMATGT